MLVAVELCDLGAVVALEVGGLPFAAPAELWWWCGGDRVEHGVELGVDLDGTPVHELRGGNAVVVMLVVLDVPGHRPRLASGAEA